MFSTLYAQGSEAASGGGLQSILPFILIFAIFYFLLIRPQQRKAKQLDKKRNALQKGDKIVTAGGLFATVTQIKDENTLVVEISKGVQVEVVKTTILNVVSSKEEKKAEKEKAAKKK